MIKFEKVSFEQFEKDAIKLGYESHNLKEIYENIELPKRATTGSAGYDFVTPFDFNLIAKNTNDSVTIPTGIRCKMDRDFVLMLYPRSGLGFKSGVSLANTTGVIDPDYWYASNEGHIMLKLVPGFKDLHVSARDRVMQGVFLKYYLVDGDDYIGGELRCGGFGSTGK